MVNRKDGSFIDSKISDITQFLPKNSFLVFNNSKVRRARVFAKGTGGGEIELVFLSSIDNISWQVVLRKSGSKAAGTKILFENGMTAQIKSKQDLNVLIELDRKIDEDFFEKYGHIPLPPYITREDIDLDSERYQTVYADLIGSAAAPTAGLHFTDEIFKEIDQKGFERLFVTLHVGLGTFAPVQTENIEDHIMHEEFFSIDESTCKKIIEYKQANKKLCAIGTTSVRTLESAFSLRDGLINSGSTRAYIFPGYKFNLVDHLFTNFHTPESSLFILVNAFMGMELARKAYLHAIEKKYRFFSYGDAMLII